MAGAIEIRPQAGPQSEFLSCPADLAIYGGAAGGGKTWALLLEPLRHIHNPAFGAVCFRRTSPQITNEGGLWDEASNLYPLLGAEPRIGDLEWRFPSGACISFRHLQHESTKYHWQGSQVPLFLFDELTHFTEGQFFYLLSRNRSLCGVKPYIRAGCNPDPHSWVKQFLAPWLVKGHPVAAVDGEIRWFLRDGGLITWYRSIEDAPATERAFCKSVAFIRSSIHDNKILLAKDPGYLANLRALPAIERARLLDGDWDAVAQGNLFKREFFMVLPTIQPCESFVRHWDLAATEERDGNDPDWTAGVLMGRRDNGTLVVLDVVRLRGTPGAVEAAVRRTAISDRERFGPGVKTTMEQEPGSAGVSLIHHYGTRVLQGFPFSGVRPTGDKVTRAMPLVAQAELGNVILVDGPWLGDFLNELVAFPTPGVHDDQVDAAAGAFAELVDSPVMGFC